MSSRGIAVLLLLTAAIGLFAIIQDFRFDGWIAGEYTAAARVDRELAALPAPPAGLQPADSSAAGAAVTERQTIDANILKLSRLRLAMNAIALIFAVGAAALLGRAVVTVSAREPSTAQMLRDLPPPVKGAGASGATHPQPTAGGTAALTVRASNLAAAAELCVDLARVADAADMPALLERALTVLDAKGIVLWAADESGAMLRPSLSHGYPDKVLMKLRPLQVDSDNVTSLAFRSLQPQALNGMSVTDPAAIAIPLLTGSGCVGVMAAELKHNRPHADLLPVAKIIGAQLSTLIAPPERADRAHAAQA